MRLFVCVKRHLFPAVSRRAAAVHQPGPGVDHFLVVDSELVLRCADPTTLLRSADRLQVQHYAQVTYVRCSHTAAVSPRVQAVRIWGKK